MDEGPAPYETLLGSADIESLADPGNSIGFVRGMNILPVTHDHVVRLAMLTALPLVLLVFVVIPVAAILDYLG